MEGKKVVATALAAAIAVSVSPVNAIDESKNKNVTLGYSEDDEDNGVMLMSNEDVAVKKISETDTSITISWTGFNNDKVSYYTAVCNGLESGKISECTYTINGLTSGCEYSIAVRAYDEEDKLIGSSQTIYEYTDWNAASDTVLEPVHIKIASKIIAKVRFPKYRTSSLS